jgi:hypothetical protein
MRKRRSADSSLELFLDTICNVFGGILFIAILIAIQIQQTQGIVKMLDTPSPEIIAEAQQKFDQISADIDASRVLLETLQAAMPRPKDPAEQERAEKFYKLSSAQGTAIEKKAKLIDQLLAAEKERLDWEEKIKNLKTTLQQKESERKKIEQEIEQQQQKQQTQSASSETLQSEINLLNQQITQKENNLKTRETHQQRNEVIYLPKLRDAGSKLPVYYVLRFNRFYAVANRHVDFDYTGDLLGTPKKDRGIPVDDLVQTKEMIRKIFQGHNDRLSVISVFVYGDSADQWYIIRDLIVAAGFEYELKPSEDDTEWVFGAPGGAPLSVQ